MPESTPLIELVGKSLDEFLSERAAEFAGISPDLATLVPLARGFMSGGKRYRALFCYWGWRSIQVGTDAFDPMPQPENADDIEAIVFASAALEMFHAAALVHDDIMDNSDTRRGAPSAHRSIEAHHRDGGWRGDATAFGRNGALLLGDLLLGWSDELFDSAGLRVARAEALASRREFVRMRTEVTAGQYLDILEEGAWVASPDSEALTRAQRVVVYKSAKYSIEAPLAIGATLGGATDAQIAALRAFGLPLGVAFQLRDDLLGVFGDPEQTGKPAGDDLREGKRTVLIALARSALPASARSLIDELLGEPDLDDEQVSMIRTALKDSGAVDRVEAMIARHVQIARAALADAPLTPSAKVELDRLAETVTRRVA